MKRIPQAEIARRDELVKELNAAYGKLETEVEVYNAELERVDKIVEAETAYNESVARLNAWAWAVVENMIAYMFENGVSRDNPYREWSDAYYQNRIEAVSVHRPSAIKLAGKPPDANLLDKIWPLSLPKDAT